MKGECLKLLSILHSQLAAHLAPWHLQNMAMPLEDAWNWERSRTESREKPYPLFLVRDHVKNPEQHCEGVAADGFTIASTRDPSISCNVFCVFIIIIIFFFFNSLKTTHTQLISSDNCIGDINHKQVSVMSG